MNMSTTQNSTMPTVTNDDDTNRSTKPTQNVESNAEETLTTERLREHTAMFKVTFEIFDYIVLLNVTQLYDVYCFLL